MTKNYDRLIRLFQEIVSPKMPWESKLVTLIGLLKQEMPLISWVGAYLEAPPGSGTLWVGPYQGPVACIEIPPGRGVCGSAFRKQACEIVPDVHAFPDHIACDSKSRSEIVVPLRKGGRLVGVLDLDSHSPAAFDTEDEKGLEALLHVLEAS